MYVNDWPTAHFGHLVVRKQHVFMKHRSTASNILVFINFVAKCLNSRHEVDAIDTDVSNAFHTGNYNILLPKLSLLNFLSSVISLFSWWETPRHY